MRDEDRLELEEPLAAEEEDLAEFFLSVFFLDNARDYYFPESAGTGRPAKFTLFVVDSSFMHKSAPNITARPGV